MSAPAAMAMAVAAALPKVRFLKSGLLDGHVLEDFGSQKMLNTKMTKMLHREHTIGTRFHKMNIDTVV